MGENDRIKEIYKIGPSCPKTEMGKPKSNAERQREFRRRRDSDPERRRKYLEEKKTKYQNDRTMKKRLRIDEMSEREQRRQRRCWRRWKRSSMLRKQEVENIHTPPSSPVHVPEQDDAAPPVPDPSMQLDADVLDNQANAVKKKQSANNQPSRQRKRGINMKKKKENKLRRLNEKLLKENEKAKREIEKYKARLKRYNRKLERQNMQTLTPRSKTRVLLRQFSKNDKGAKKNICKKLVFHDCVISQVNENYQRSSTKKKDVIRKVMSGRIIKKYRCQGKLLNALGVTSGKRNKERKVKARAAELFRQTITDFYLRDDISRICAGKKDCLTKNGVKQQKRYLFETLKKTWGKFIAEGKRSSYSFFCKFRPFFVVEPKCVDRETCLCRIHENFEMMANSLYKKGLLATDDTDKLLEMVPDGDESRLIEHPFIRPCDPDERISVPQWTQGTKEYTDSEGNSKTAKIVCKQVQEWNYQVAEERFVALLKQMKRHVYNWKHQSNVLRTTKEHLPETDCILIVDFSENYQCKYHKAIQSAHFGASNSQVSLHTSVCYVREGMEVKPMPFCTFANDLHHGPSGIWAHLQPVLKHIRENCPKVKVIHFWSDGPSGQYKQKGNFYLFCTEIYKAGFESGTWNFFESSHGKGPADGIGAVVKRVADKAVSGGRDIQSAQVMMTHVIDSGSKINCYFIEEEAFSMQKKCLPDNLSTLKGTQSLHQVASTTPGTLFYRNNSCFCKWLVAKTPKSLLCECFNIKSTTYVFEGDVSFQSDAPGIAKQPEQEQLPPEPTVIDVGDYVLVRLRGLRHSRGPPKHCVAKVDHIDEDDHFYEGQFMGKVRSHKAADLDYPMFAFKEDDEGRFTLADVIKKLPQPQLKGGTARRSAYLQFHDDIFAAYQYSLL